MRLDLPAGDHLPRLPNGDDEPPPIETRWIDPNQIDQFSDLRRFGFQCGSNLVAAHSN